MNIFFRVASVGLLVIGVLGLTVAYADNKSPAALASARGSDFIELNQIGYLPSGHKVAMVSALKANEFSVVSDDGKTVFEGKLSATKTWPMAADKPFKVADFSALKTDGRYHLHVKGVGDSYSFAIAADVFGSLHDGALKAYYFNRASTALDEKYAGKFARPMGHPDTNTKIHRSSASAERPAGTVVPSAKGWYDAGDYGKYVVNSGISTYTLLLALQQHPDFYRSRDINIPESNNNVPDILDEVMWNLEWLATMQDPHDGGVYHKLSTEHFAGMVMPDKATDQRYFAAKSTAATLDFAALMAAASRTLAKYETPFPGVSAKYLKAAQQAYAWALANPHTFFDQRNSGFSTGGYGDSHLDDEFAWAAAELFVSTGDARYLKTFKDLDQKPTVPSWNSVAALGYYSLLTAGKARLSAADAERYTSALTHTANTILDQYRQSTYQVAMEREDFVWGSNAVAMNKAMLLLLVDEINGSSEYREAALSLVDYVLGRNPTGYSFISGFGSHTPMHIHHRTSQADGIVDPVPGWMAGGPQPGQQDRCVYPSKEPALSYLDEVCSFSTNEIAINWNAPLVFVLAALSQH